jgi:hypothetical protein
MDCGSLANFLVYGTDNPFSARLRGNPVKLCNSSRFNDRPETIDALKYSGVEIPLPVAVSQRLDGVGKFLYYFRSEAAEFIKRQGQLWLSEGEVEIVLPLRIPISSRVHSCRIRLVVGPG